MNLKRCSGVLLHLTSLPGKYGVGTLDQEAYDFVDFLERTQQTVWQVLPLGPTSFGDSPYQSLSTHAGNPYLIGLETMVADGLLSWDALNAAIPALCADNREKTNFEALYNHKLPLLRRAAEDFLAASEAEKLADFRQFCAENSDWLDDYVLFMALKDKYNNTWFQWPDELKTRKKKALNAASKELAHEMDIYRFIQWVFFTQWNKLRAYANQKGIKILGDLPIYVAMDSSDAWSNTGLFSFDKRKNPELVAGVPPDYFAKDGQLWGNPIYNWAKMRRDGFAWWKKRMASALKMYDLVRIDHFRGLAEYWTVPFGAKTARAEEGCRWVKGPGADFLMELQEEFGEDLPIVAEDLGDIDEKVLELRDSFKLPGMKVLQFAFSATAEHPFMPHNFTENFIVYTGTHDNQTTRGWYEAYSLKKEGDAFRRYFSTDGWDMAWTMIRGAFASVARVAVIPMQDILDLGDWARMNTPGKAEGNWMWRYTADKLNAFVENRLLDMTKLYGRERVKEQPIAETETEQSAESEE